MTAQDRRNDLVDLNERDSATGPPYAVPLPTGQQIFDRMDPAEQDAQFGTKKAEALRNGDVKLADLVAESEMATEQNFITEKPLEAT